MRRRPRMTLAARNKRGRMPSARRARVRIQHAPPGGGARARPRSIFSMFGLGLIARTAAEIRRDVAAAKSRDPAARGVGAGEILATWPGVHALLAHRVAHALYLVRVPLLPRLIAAIARPVTGIEVHPAAKI